MMKTTTTKPTEPTLSESIEKVILTVLGTFLSISLYSVLCYFPLKWAFPDNHITVAQWFMVVIIAKLLKTV